MSPNDNIFLEEGQQEGPKKEHRVFAAACYIPFVGLAMPSLTGTEQTEFTQLHYWQGSVLFGLHFICTLLIFILPLVGFRIWGLVTLIYMVLAGWGGYQGYLGNSLEYSFLKPIITKVRGFIQSQKSK